MKTVFLYPLYWQQRPRDNVPSTFQILGGLILARDCQYKKGYYSYRTLFFIPLSGKIPMDRTATEGPLNPGLDRYMVRAVAARAQDTGEFHQAFP
jgi:hypothetical protein